MASITYTVFIACTLPSDNEHVIHFVRVIETRQYLVFEHSSYHDTRIIKSINLLVGTRSELEAC